MSELTMLWRGVLLGGCHLTWQRRRRYSILGNMPQLVAHIPSLPHQKHFPVSNRFSSSTVSLGCLMGVQPDALGIPLRRFTEEPLSRAPYSRRDMNIKAAKCRYSIPYSSGLDFERSNPLRLTCRRHAFLDASPFSPPACVFRTRLP